MILNFYVSNFRSIYEEINLSFEPVFRRNESESEYKYFINKIGNENILKLAIIYGANASGKTNILKAIDFFRNFVLFPPKDKNEEIGDSFSFRNFYKPFLLRGDEENSSLTLEFFAKGIRYLYSVIFNKKQVVEEYLYFYSPKKSLVFKRFTIDGNVEIYIGNKFKRKIKKIQKEQLLLNTFPNQLFLSSFLKVNLPIEEIENVLFWFKSILKPIITPSTRLTGWVFEKLSKNELDKKIALEVLKSADFTIEDFNFNEIELEGKDLSLAKFLEELLSDMKNSEKSEDVKEKIKGLELFVKHNINGKEMILDFEEDESRGTHRFFELSHIISLLMKKPCVIPIDEIEASLHPDLLRYFLELFLLYSHPESQLILTTHSRELLKEMDILRHDILWFTEKKEDGSTDLFALTDFSSNVIRDTSSIYNKYKLGKLGAVPNLGFFNPPSKNK
ncbi:conserved hypothetical protein [Thermotomaculum hydrothermale]|uniref:ATPase AAA-type core domain-containing protein n=1 Tax=Thermotomaculum hydrothermale TaxID=981385 RepID=A0A7R6SY99_9BACT|nr:ATP-binding protein [Thermotomaculum hydrothermale]BBB32549.1 conserved hypothetical protein [Thermotomaculum hydrothermale]